MKVPNGALAATAGAVLGAFLARLAKGPPALKEKNKIDDETPLPQPLPAAHASLTLVALRADEHEIPQAPGSGPLLDSQLKRQKRKSPQGPREAPEPYLNWQPTLLNRTLSL